MTNEAFQEEKINLLTISGSHGREAAGRREQALALLYEKSGWTQRALAEIEQTSQKNIDRHLRFARFLLLSPDRTQAGLGEWSFRTI